MTSVASSLMADGDRVSARLTTAPRRWPRRPSPVAPSGGADETVDASRSRRSPHPGQDLPLPVVQARLDVHGEHEGAALGPDAERDGHRVVALVADGHGDAAHAQLVGATQGAVVQPHRRLAGRQAHDLDLAPADPPDAQSEDLAHRLLGRPPAGQVLRPVAHVGSLGVGQDALREPLAEARQRLADAIHLDDVDAQLGRALGRLHQPGPRCSLHGHRPGQVADAGSSPVGHSTVTDLARLRGWSTSVPRTTAM